MKKFTRLFLVFLFGLQLVVTNVSASVPYAPDEEEQTSQVQQLPVTSMTQDVFKKMKVSGDGTWDNGISFAIGKNVVLHFEGAPDKLSFQATGKKVGFVTPPASFKIEESADNISWTEVANLKANLTDQVLKPTTRYIKFSATVAATITSLSITELTGFRTPSTTNIDFGSFQLGHNPEAKTVKLQYGAVGTITLSADDEAYKVNPATIDGSKGGETTVSVTLEPTATGDFTGKKLTVAASAEGVAPVEIALSGICLKKADIVVNKAKAPYYYNTTIDDFITVNNTEKDELLAMMTTASTNEAVAKMDGNKLVIYDVEGSADITVTFPGQDGWAEVKETFTVTPMKDPRILPLKADNFTQETFSRVFSGDASWDKGAKIGAGKTATINFVGVPNEISFSTTQELEVKQSADGAAWTDLPKAKGSYTAVLNPATRYVQVKYSTLNILSNAVITNLAISELNGVAVDDASVAFDMTMAGTESEAKKVVVRYNNIDAEGVALSIEPADAPFQFSPAAIVAAEGETFGTKEVEVKLVAPAEWPEEAEGDTRAVTATLKIGDYEVALTGDIHKAIDVAALDGAITSAADDVIAKIGFEAGEYAPYNLAPDFYEAYDAAVKTKSNITAAEMTQAAVDEAASNLATAIGNSKVNAEAVNAIDPAASLALPFEYGKADKYHALPLAKETLYSLAFNYAGGSVTVSATDKDGNKVIDDIVAPAPVSEEAKAMLLDAEEEGETPQFVPFQGYICTNNSDNYVITIKGDAGAEISDIMLTKVNESDITLDFTPQTIADGGQYYIYNVLTDRFLTSKGLEVGSPILYTAKKDGESYKIVNGDNGLNITITPNEGLVLGVGGGPDPKEVTVDAMGEACAFTIGGNEKGYTFSVTEQWKYMSGLSSKTATYTSYLASAVSGDDVILTQTAVPTSYYNKWILVTKKEYDSSAAARAAAIGDFKEAYAKAREVYDNVKAPAVSKLSLGASIAGAALVNARLTTKLLPASISEIRKSTESLTNATNSVLEISDFYVSSLQDISNVEKMGDNSPSLSTEVKVLTAAARLGLEVPTKNAMKLTMGTLRAGIVTSVLLSDKIKYGAGTDLTGLLANHSFDTGDMSWWYGLKVDLSNINDLLGIFSGATSGNVDMSKILQILDLIGFNEASCPVVQDGAHGKYVYETAVPHELPVIGEIKQGQQAAQVILGMQPGDYKFMADMESIGNTAVGASAIIISVDKLRNLGFDLTDAATIAEIIKAISGGEGSVDAAKNIFTQVLKALLSSGSNFLGLVDVQSGEFVKNETMKTVECNFTCKDNSIVVVTTCGRDNSLLGSLMGGVSGMLGNLGEFGSLLTSIAPYRADNAHLLYVGDTPTGITNHAADAAEKDVIYDLSGRRMNKTTAHGLYIINGEKVVK